MKINHLLEKYFEGDTSQDEEKKLYEYFLSSDILPEHQQYKPIFQHFNSEKMVRISNSDFDKGIIAQIYSLQKRKTIFKVIYKISTVAASLLIIIGSLYFFYFNKNDINNKLLSKNRSTNTAIDTTIAINHLPVIEKPENRNHPKKMRHRYTEKNSRQENLVIKQFKNAMIIVARNLEKADKHKTAINIIDSSMYRIQKIIKAEQDKLLLTPHTGD